jgi:hypothetical protein
MTYTADGHDTDVVKGQRPRSLWQTMPYYCVCSCRIVRRIIGHTKLEVVKAWLDVLNWRQEMEHMHSDRVKVVNLVQSLLDTSMASIGYSAVTLMKKLKKLTLFPIVLGRKFGESNAIHLRLLRWLRRG